MINVPRAIVVLCRDLIAGDSTLKDTIDVGEELHGALGHWLEQLRAERRAEEIAEREAEERETRRVMRRQSRHGVLDPHN